MWSRLDFMNAYSSYRSLQSYEKYGIPPKEYGEYLSTKRRKKNKRGGKKR